MAKRKERAGNVVQFKTFQFDTKAVAEEPDNDGLVYISGYGSVFDNVDSHNDVIVKGAYADTLAAWAEKGAPIPSYYNHGAFSSDPHDNIGFLQEASEDGHGLKVRMALDVAHNEKAAYAHRLIKQGRLREMSIGYIPKTWELIHEEGKREWEYTRKLTAVDLLEVSLVSVASNPLATVTEKAAALLYGIQADEDATDADLAEEEDDTEAKADSDVQAAAQEVLAAAQTLQETTATLIELLAEGDDDESDDDTTEDDSTSTEAGAKSGLSLSTRATLALIALDSADKENAR